MQIGKVIHHFKIFFVMTLMTLFGCSSKNVTHNGLIDINGTQLFVKTIGSGEPVLIIHGGPALSHDYFLPHLRGLGQSFNLIFYDQRGAGRSSVDQQPEQMTLEDFIDDIESIRKVLDIGQFHIISHSWGAQLASEYVIRYSENVKSLTYISPSPHTNKFNEEISEKQQFAMDSAFIRKRARILNSDSFKAGEAESYEELFKLSFSLSFLDKAKIDDLNLNITSNFIDSQRLLQHLSGFGETDLLEELKSLKIRTLVIRGKYDIASYNADQQLAFALNGEFSEMETGHFPFIEKNDEFNKIMLNFLLD